MRGSGAGAQVRGEHAGPGWAEDLTHSELRMGEIRPGQIAANRKKMKICMLGVSSLPSPDY